MPAILSILSWDSRPTQPVGPYGESSPVVIGEPQVPLTDVPPEETILFDHPRRSRFAPARLRTAAAARPATFFVVLLE
jgi:hypothetical protein